MFGKVYELGCLENFYNFLEIIYLFIFLGSMTFGFKEVIDYDVVTSTLFIVHFPFYLPTVEFQLSLDEPIMRKQRYFEFRYNNTFQISRAIVIPP